MTRGCNPRTRPEFLQQSDLCTCLQGIDLIPAPTDLNRVPAIHLQWSEITEKLKQNIEMTHRCHGYFLSRMYFSDVPPPPSFPPHCRRWDWLHAQSM